MIYVTGDTHGDIDIGKLSNRSLKRRKINIKEGDYLVILGDFGLPFFDSDITQKRGSYHWWIKWLSQKPYTILWIDGNHENFNYWDKQKITEWNGGKVQIHPDAHNVIHLMRGQIYTIEEKSVFTFGGACSHDKQYRIPNVSWWEQEVATNDEIKTAIDNLNKHNNTVDYIFTHTPPQRIMAELFGSNSAKDKTADFLNYMLKNVNYKLWLCGHIHKQYNFGKEKIISLYNGIYSIEEIPLFLNKTKICKVYAREE